MPNIISNNPDVISTFSKIADIIFNEGGFIHPDIRIIEENGNLIVESALDRSNNDIIFSVPSSCLPDTRDFSILLEGDDLVLGPSIVQVTDIHKVMCGLMLDLFNLTKKIAYHKKIFPIPLLNNPYSYKLIARKCPGICTKYKAQRKNLTDEQLLVKTFLGCRQLNIQLKESSNSQVLLPFIDSLNHHPNSPGYDITYDTHKNSGNLTVRHSKALSGSDECFVNYGYTDPMPRYFQFGYLDTQPNYLQSVSTVIHLPGLGKIIVQPFENNPRDTAIIFPNQLQHKKYFLPNCIKRNGYLLVWRILIPVHSNPNTLRRILEVLIINLRNSKIKKKRLEQHIKFAEDQLIKTNKNYFKEMLALADSQNLADIPKPMIADLKKLAILQLTLLNDYQKKSSKSPLVYL